MDGGYFDIYIECENGQKLSAKGSDEYPEDYDIKSKVLEDYLEKIK